MKFGSALIALTLVLLAACSAPQPVSHLTWDPPTVNADGSALAGPLTFNVYRGTTSTNLQVIATVAVPNYDDHLAPGTWFYAVTAIAAGSQSAYSAIVSAQLADPQIKSTGGSP